MIKQEEAAKIAQPHLNKDEVNIVFVNQDGLYWINNTREQMADYFRLKNQKYFVFEKQEAEEKPKAESGEGKKSTKKKS